MCGIVGCVGDSGSDVAERVLKGLRRLAYRGYDSAGIAVIEGDGRMHSLRRAGKLANLERAVHETPLHGSVGLGHTRWATHGSPSEQNAHPHRDCSGRLVVVHNGIIENYQELRQRLRESGHRFTSETDSEVLAHLIESHLAGDLSDAVRAALREVRGAYAIGVLHSSFPDTLVGARKDCPLVVGVRAGEALLASDVPALLEATRDVTYLEDGDVATLRPGGVSFTDLLGAPQDRAPHRIEWDLLTAEKGGFKHFMLKEIHEQPRVVADVLMGRFDEAGDDVLLPEIRLDAGAARALDRITIVACGTSWHAGLVGKFLIESAAGIPVEVDVASEFRYRHPLVGGKTLVVAVSQSGETADTLAGLRLARSLGARTLSVCNVIGSSIAREAHDVLDTRAGPEIGVASTKAFTSQIVALHLVAIRLGRLRGALSEEAARRKIAGLRAVRGAIEEALRREERIDALAGRLVSATDVLYLGRGINYPIGLEGALKLKEISYVHAEGYPAGEMKHGPIALVDEKLPVIFLATPGEVYEKVLSNMEEVRARGGRIVAVAADGDAKASAIADETVFVPRVEEELSPLVNVVPLQLLAYHVALRRGCDVDQPRNLAKSVTVE